MIISVDKILIERERDSVAHLDYDENIYFFLTYQWFILRSPIMDFN